MTFQVALIATDGIILGSDRKLAIRSPEPGGHVQFTEGDKIVFSRDKSVICGFAGGPQAQNIADAIVCCSDPDQSLAEWHNSLVGISEKVSGNSLRDEVLVIRKGIPDLVLVNRTQKAATAVSVTDRICTGVPATARFLTQHFWRPDPAELLKRLALLALDYAAKERPTEVGFGFDLIVVNEGPVLQDAYYPEDQRIVNLREEFKAAVRGAL